ncbi:ATP-binding cassette domain-containing protein [Ruania suaedae]|uniref:ABC transporter ATP-binding protein n=1 Tax=Ruania suaedae TaxID=2897774 RepID=UPI001E2B1B2C|nr:ATP-binding cassette domain-containing protein [Ruania suaedae]UFU04493.1 ATP-binding cassette domain-containing protein [Ruania suaedae]
MSAPALEVRDLTRRFGEKVAVDNVSFTVEPGTMTGFVGANGAGKTSTMRMIMGVLARHGGEVLWDGRPITRADRAAFGYMPEERGLYPKQGILDQLCYLGQLRGLTRGDAAAEAQRLLERFSLGGRAKDKLESLSLGNQQRVQVAAALLHGPTALILDEPFSGLDPVAVDSMVDLLSDKLRDGVPVLFSSHQLDLVDRLCDSLVVLSDGVVMASGTAHALRSRGPRRFRITTPPDAGWLREVADLQVLDVDGATAIVESPGPLDRALITRAAAFGLTELTPLVPTLADIYREVTA